jgi:tRNA-dihydrouridine synthase B
MIGRAAQGRPWICREIDHFLRTGTHLPAPLVDEVRALMDEHLQAHYAFYGEFLGVRTARKHIGWYVRELEGGEQFRQQMNLLESTRRSWPPSTIFLNRNIGSESGYNTGPRVLLKWHGS